MNQQEEMRIAIAEACGWSDIKQGPYDGSPFGRHETHQLLPLPDYCNDLNAIAEAERTLVFSKRQQYFRELQKVCSKGMDGVCLVAKFEICLASPTQRAEAFCRTLKIGPFKEEPK